MNSLKKTPKKLVAALAAPRTLTGLRYLLRGWLNQPSSQHKPNALKLMAPSDDAFRELSFTFAVIALSARVACVDGTLSQRKYVAFRESFPLRGGLCGKIRSLFSLACDNPIPFEHYVAQIKYIFPERQELFVSLVERLFRIAAADGSVSRESERLVGSIAHGLNVSAAEYAAICNRYRQPLKPHHVLGIEKNPEAATLKARYRELMRRYHPDRFASHSLSPEMEMLLKLKASEINDAYQILSERAA